MPNTTGKTSNKSPLPNPDQQKDDLLPCYPRSVFIATKKSKDEYCNRESPGPHSARMYHRLNHQR